MKCFVFNSEAEAEKFVNEGYPKYGVDLDGNEVRDKGVTLRASDFRKNPKLDEWYVEYSEELFGDRDKSNLEDIDLEKVFPPANSMP